MVLEYALRALVRRQGVWSVHVKRVFASVGVVFALLVYTYVHTFHMYVVCVYMRMYVCVYVRMCIPVICIGRTDGEQIRSRVNDNDCRTFRPRRPLSAAHKTVRPISTK